MSASLSLSPLSQFVSPGFVFHLGWGAVSASLGLSANLSPIWLCLSPWVGCCVRLAELVSCLPICLPICLPPVFHLGCGAVSAALGLSPNLSSIWLCLSPWLGCCVRLAGLVSNLSPTWLCLPVFSPHLFPIWLCLSPWLGCCVRLAGLISGLVSQFVSHLAVSQFSLAICFPSGFVFHLGWGAVSASLGLSPNLFPTWLCLSPWLGCCVRLAGLVSQFVSHPIWLCLSPWLVGVLCPPRWACLWSCLPICLLSGFVSQFCLPICLPSGFVFHLGWGAVSASLGLSLVLSLLSGFVSQFCFPICFPSGFVFHLGWGAVSTSLGLSPVSHLALSFTLAAPWLGCCVCLAGLVCGLVLFCLPSCFPASVWSCFQLVSNVN